MRRADRMSPRFEERLADHAEQKSNAAMPTSAPPWSASIWTRCSSAAISMPASKARSSTPPASRSCIATSTSCIPLKGEPTLVFPARGALDRRQEEALRAGESLGRDSRPLAARARARRRLEARRRLRPRLHHGRARLSRAAAGRVRDSFPSTSTSTWRAPSRAKKNWPKSRDTMDIIHDGFWALLDGFEPGKTEAEIMAPAVEVFFARGAGPRMMNIVLSGENGEAEAHFKVPGHRVVERRRPDALLAGDRRRGRLLGGVLARAHSAASPASAPSRWPMSIPRRWKPRAS